MNDGTNTNSRSEVLSKKCEGESDKKCSPQENTNENKNEVSEKKSEKKPMNSPQPPRVMSIRQRRLMMSCRKQGSNSQSVRSQQHESQLKGRKRPRASTPIPELNDLAPTENSRLSYRQSSSSASAGSSRLNSAQSQSYSSQSTRYISGSSQSQTSRSLFANLGALQSQSQWTRNRILPQAKITNAEDVSEDVSNNISGRQKDPNISKLQTERPLPMFESDLNLTAFKSPKPNLSGGIGTQKTPSSLFGEIMKRAPLEIGKEEFVESSNAANNNLIGDFAVALNSERKDAGTSASASRNFLHPPPVLRPSISSLDQDQHQRKLKHSGGPNIHLPSTSSSKHFITSLMPSLSLAPRKRNIFKQFSKSSTNTKPVEAATAAAAAQATMRERERERETGLAPMFGTASPQRRARLSSHASPSKPAISKLRPSDYGTPVRSKHGHSVAWDPSATPTRTPRGTSAGAGGALFRRSPKTPDVEKYKHSKTPPRSKRHVNWDPRTPDTQRKLTMTPNGMNRYYNSPGGFALQRVLDGCLSPHLSMHQHFDEKKDEVELEMNDKEGSKSSITSLSGDVDDWKECWLRIPSFVESTIHGNDAEVSDFSSLARGAVGVVDWSMKSNVKIECNPVNCIPGAPFQCSNSSSIFSFANIPDQNKIEEMALEIFMNPNKRAQAFPVQNQKEEEEVVSAQWRAALMYWQYPAAHPMPPSLFLKPSTNSTITNTNTRRTSLTRSNTIEPFLTSNSKLSSTAGALKRQTSLPLNNINNASESMGSMMRNAPMESLADSVLAKNAPLRQSTLRPSLGSLGGLGECRHDSEYVSNTAIMVRQRRAEWQECFRCVYFKWNSKIQELINTNEIGAPIDASTWSRTCFYAISPGLTTLFRPSYVPNGNSGLSFEPMIILSSSTEIMRNSIRSMGITLRILNPDDNSGGGYIEVTERFVEEWSKSERMEDDAATTQAHEELEALRRATAHGESVGAEVSISIFKNRKFKSSPSKSPASFPPLIIQGHDECMSFYELFLNTFGFVQNKLSQAATADVPLLIARSLGPIKNMSLRHLSAAVVHGQREEPKINQQQHQLSSIELHGPIFPCAVRDIACASASYFSLHRKQSSKLKNADNKIDGNYDCNGDVDENILGSHYFMMQLQHHSGNENNNQINKPAKAIAGNMGSAGSFCFNGLVVNDKNKSNEMDMDMDMEGMSNENGDGEVTNMIVWDINRPFSIAYKSSTQIINNETSS